MVINLHTTQSPVSRSERMKINENWQKIIEGLSRLQYQINVLAGGKEVEDLLQRIEDAINNAYTSVAAAIEENNDATQEAINNVNISLEVALEKIATAMHEINTAITNANEATANADQATSNANTAAQMANDKVTEATQMIESLASLKTQLEQIKQQLLAVNKEAEIAITNANNAALETRNAIQDTNTAITNAEVATQNANQAVQDINVVKDDLTQTVKDKITEADTAITNANTATDQAKQAAENVKGWGTATVWSATTQYEKNNIVTNNGSTWQSLTTNINSGPSDSNTDWILLAQRGVDGTGSVSKVAGKSPDVDGNVTLIPSDIGAETPHGAQEKANGIKEWVQAHGLGTDKPELIASPDSLLNKTESGFWNVKNLPGSTVLPNDTEDFHVYVGMKADETSNQMYQTLLAISQKTAKTYTRVITKDGQTKGQIDDSGWIKGGGSEIEGLKINAVPYDLATTEENQKSWNIPENSYVKNNDFIIVFHNGFYLSPTSWNISGDAINGYTLNIPDNPIKEQIENNVRIIIFNNVPIDGTERFSGNLLEDGTVSIKKLGKEVQDAISNAGEKVEIINDLTTGGVGKVLSAEMGKDLKKQADKVTQTVTNLEQIVNQNHEEVTEHLADYVKHPAVATTTLVGNVYQVMLNPAPKEYVNSMGLVLTIDASYANDYYIKVNGLESKVVYTSKIGLAKNAKAGAVLSFRYSATANGGQGAFILQGESEVEIGQQIITPKTTNQAILQGVHDGTGYVAGSSNLIPSNIKSGVNLFGVVGNYEPFALGFGSGAEFKIGSTYNTNLNFLGIPNYFGDVPYGSVGSTSFVSKKTVTADIIFTLNRRKINQIYQASCTFSVKNITKGINKNDSFIFSNGSDKGKADVRNLEFIEGDTYEISISGMNYNNSPDSEGIVTGWEVTQINNVSIFIDPNSLKIR
ncbi:hypothetical protein [Lysinibacillus xylanilyticus]|uniref:hypothetical protein n=1 Tax=Lysinibacillus xylanilyticus TaxID=582475 RepID=UPI003D95140D